MIFLENPDKIAEFLWEILICCRSVSRVFHGVPGRDLNYVPFSRPAHYRLSYAAHFLIYAAPYLSYAAPYELS
jgi:hypothetical protein